MNEIPPMKDHSPQVENRHFELDLEVSRIHCRMGIAPRRMLTSVRHAHKSSLALSVSQCYHSLEEMSTSE